MAEPVQPYLLAADLFSVLYNAARIIIYACAVSNLYHCDYHCNKNNDKWLYTVHNIPPLHFSITRS